MRPRFDIVVTNHNRGEVFWEAYKKIKHLDKNRDRLIFMDCSDNPDKELKKILPMILENRFEVGKNFLFIKRRNWNLNHGAQMDYIRLLSEKKISKPKLVFFMQDHYLNTKRYVKGDTIPEGEVINLRQIETFLSRNKDVVWFCSRNGFRVSVKYNDAGDYYKYGDNYKLDLKDITALSLVIDGGNFCVDPQIYVTDYLKNKNKYFTGNGNIYFCTVWETRLCKILYDKRYSFYESHRKLRFSSIEKLKAKYPKPGSVWLYFYNPPLAYYLYGQDIYRSKFSPHYFREIFYGHGIGKSSLNFKYLIKFIESFAKTIIYNKDVGVDVPYASKK